MREQQFVIRAPNATSLVTPPTHPGAQPVLLAIGASCTNQPPACPISSGIASGYGWSLCVQPRGACEAETNPATPPSIDHAALGDMVQRLSASHGADVQSTNTIVVASGEDANALLGTAPPTDTRTREVLLVDPDTQRDIPLAATLPFTRIAWIDNTRVETHEKRNAIADQLAQRGIPFAAISPKDRSDRARSEAVVRALAWLRAGDDSHVCDATTPRTTRVTVHCNGVGDDAHAAR